LVAIPATAQSVLLLWDDDADSVQNNPPLVSELNPNTQALIAAFETAGITVALSNRTQSQYNGDTPSAGLFDVVVHLNGNRTSTLNVMPTSTVAKLLDYVQNQGGGFVTSENTEAQISIPFVGLTVLMESLALLDRDAGAPPPYGEMVLSVVPGQEGHPLLAGLPLPYAFVGGRMRGQVRTYQTDPATVLLRDESGYDALAVRDFGNGRSVTFHHTGNFRNVGQLSDTLLDPEVQRLYINAVRWADKRPPRVVGITREQANPLGGVSADFIVEFSESVTGVDASDFQAQVSGGLDFNTTVQVTALSQRRYRVRVTGLSGMGTLTLNLVDNDSVVDRSSNVNRLGGTGPGNGNANGETYTVDAVPPNLSALIADPLVVPLGGKARFTMTFTESMNTAFPPDVRVVTDAGIAIRASSAVPPPDDRVQSGLLALYTFEEGLGDVVQDVSGVGTPLDLNIAAPGNVSWIEGALRIDTPTILLSGESATKISAACKSSNEISFEAWLRPANTTQAGPARIGTLSAGLNTRNFTFGQVAGVYDTRVRSTVTSSNGVPAVLSSDNAVKTALQHVVVARSAAGVLRMYVDGVEVYSVPLGGDFSTWDEGFRLALGNELSQNRAWLGEFHLTAVYDRALSGAEVAQNFAAGPISPRAGDGAWLNALTYRVTMDRAVASADAGGAKVVVSEARDAAGNPMPLRDNFGVGIISSTLVVTLQPGPSYLREAGSQFEFAVAVSGAVGGVGYQWYRSQDGGPFQPVGPNSPVLAFNPVDLDDTGEYYCEISDTQASVTTEVSALTVVNQLPAAHLGGLALAAVVIAVVGGARRLRRA